MSKQNIAQEDARDVADSTLMTIIAVVPILALISYTVMQLFAASPEQDKSNETTQSNDAQQVPALEELTVLGYIFGVIVALIVLGLVINFAVKAYKNMIHKKTAIEQLNDETIAQWNNARSKYSNALHIMNSYERDIALAIHYPVMNDPLEPTTSAMLSSYETVKDLMISVKNDGVGGDDELLERFSNHVNDFSLKVKQAETHAKKIALSHVSDADRRDFRQAQLLLNHLQSGGNPEKTRAIYAEKLHQVVQRINNRNNVQVIPTSTMSELIESTRLEIV